MAAPTTASAVHLDNKIELFRAQKYGLRRDGARTSHPIRELMNPNFASECQTESNLD